MQQELLEMKKHNYFVSILLLPVCHMDMQLPRHLLQSRYYEDIKHKVELWFDNVRNMAKDEGIPDIKTEIFIDVKSVIESILDYASHKNIDLIVIGTRGRTGLKRFFMGSVANGVLQHAHCPVLVVR